MSASKDTQATLMAEGLKIEGTLDYIGGMIAYIIEKGNKTEEMCIQEATNASSDVSLTNTEILRRPAPKRGRLKSTMDWIIKNESDLCTMLEKGISIRAASSIFGLSSHRISTWLDVDDAFTRNVRAAIARRKTSRSRARRSLQRSEGTR